MFDRPVPRVVVVALGAGIAFGAATSLVNDLSSGYGTFGPRLAGTPFVPVLKVLSILLDAGWSWAALAVLLGWYASAAGRGALVGAAGGALACLSASVAYFCMDAPLRGEPLSGYFPEMGVWAIASVVFGPTLGAIGSQIGRKGPVGMLAGLTVPVGAVVQMLIMPTSPIAGTGVHVAADVVVWAAGAAVAAFVVARALRSPSPT